MAYTNIKTEIDGKIYTNILREITGDILNEVLKKMVDSLGKGYRYMGILDPDGSVPSGDENMFMIATEAGYYPAVSDDIPSGITICTFAEGSQTRETILNLDDLFSSNHNWGGDNTFSQELSVAFESLIDLNSDDNLQDMLNALMPRVLTAVENHIATFDAYGRAKDSGVSVDDLAKKEGISEKLVSGSARGILSPSAIEELFLFQRTANGAGGTGAAIFQSIKGNSIVWNQLVDYVAPQIVGDTTHLTCTREADGRYKIVLSAQVTELSNIVFAPIVSNGVKAGHKYMRKVGESDNLAPYLGYNSGNGVWWQWIPSGLVAGDSTFTPSATADLYGTFYVGSALPAGTYYFLPALFDLTLGNMESLTTAQFKALFPLGFYAPNPGAIKNNCATGMVTDGLNQWDEIWGLNVNNRVITSRISVFPNTTYCIHTTFAFNLFEYDANIAQVGSAVYVESGFNAKVITTSAQTRYLRILMDPGYGTTYKNDICINLSGSRNGQYEPHWSDTTALPITTATGKLNGEGASVVITPNGFAGVGTSFDEGIVEKGMWTKDRIRLEEVDLGTLDWAYNSDYGMFTVLLPLASNNNVCLCSKYEHSFASSSQTMADKSYRISVDGTKFLLFKDSAYTDAATFKEAMDGVKLIYELATPQLYVLDTPVPVVARVDEDGTQTILPQGVDESGVPMTAPFKASIQYPVKMGIGPIGQQSLVNLLEKMKSAGKIASYTMVWDATTGVYDFTIS